MKSLILIIFNFCFVLISIAQSPRNKNWVIGLEPVKFIFNENGLKIDTIKNWNSITPPFTAVAQSCSNISDLEGNLLFYSSGFVLFDKDGYAINNGKQINCPLGTKLCTNYGGLSLFHQTDIILPKKGNQYYVFATGMSDSAADKYLNHTETIFDVLNYSVVDMDSNNGMGEVVVKNKIIMQNQRYWNVGLTAVKHANGKDWWLVKSDCLNNRFQLFLVKEDSIEGPFYQNFGITSYWCTWPTKLNFSSDGSKLIGNIYRDYYENSEFNRTEIYDFDRCTGTITYNQHFFVPFDTITYMNWDKMQGVEFSPNGKLAYVCSMYNVWQIDLENPNKKDALLLSGPDTTLNVFPWYDMLALGPDNKIYIGTASGSRALSTIDSPDVKGLGCKFHRHGVRQNYNYLLCPPNMPNYGLGALVGSACDTIRAVPQNWLLYPNPAASNITIKIPNSKQGTSIQLQVYNLLGQKIIDKQVLISIDFEATLDVASLPRSIYIVKAKYGTEEFNSKFLKE